MSLNIIEVESSGTTALIVRFSSSAERDRFKTAWIKVMYADGEIPMQGIAEEFMRDETEKGLILNIWSISSSNFINGLNPRGMERPYKLIVEHDGKSQECDIVIPSRSEPQVTHIGPQLHV